MYDGERYYRDVERDVLSWLLRVVIPDMYSKIQSESEESEEKQENKRARSSSRRVSTALTTTTTTTYSDLRRDVYFIQVWSLDEYPPWPCLFPADKAPLVYIGDSRTLTNVNGQPVPCYEIQKKFGISCNFRSKDKWLDLWTSATTSSFHAIAAPSMWGILFLDPSKWQKHIKAPDSQRLRAYFAAMLMSILRIDLNNVDGSKDLDTHIVKDENVQRLVRTTIELCDFTDIDFNLVLERVGIYVAANESKIRQVMRVALQTCGVRARALLKQQMKEQQMKEKKESVEKSETTEPKKKRQKRRAKVVVKSQTEAQEKILIEKLLSDNFGMCPETESNLRLAIVRVVGNLVRDSSHASSSNMMLVWSRAMMKWRSRLDTESQEFSHVCFMCLRKIEVDMNSQNSDESFFERSYRKCSHCPVRWHARCLNVKKNSSSCCPVCSQNMKVRKAIKTLDLLELETVLKNSTFFSPCFRPMSQSKGT